MSDFKLVEYTKEEHEADMRKAIKEKGLYAVVNEITNEIDEEVRSLPYLSHRTVQEFLSEILYAIKIKEQKND